MVKRSPHYALDSIQRAFSTETSLRMTRSAQNTSLALGLSLSDVVEVVQRTNRMHFYKSMTSLADARIWQDVYHVPFQGLVLYVKFTTDSLDHLLISFKER